MHVMELIILPSALNCGITERHYATLQTRKLRFREVRQHGLVTQPVSDRVEIGGQIYLTLSLGS